LKLFLDLSGDERTDTVIGSCAEVHSATVASIGSGPSR
jgi:hypothetical protein